VTIGDRFEPFKRTEAAARESAAPNVARRREGTTVKTNSHDLLLSEDAFAKPEIIQKGSERSVPRSRPAFTTDVREAGLPGVGPKS
jgi:hypothetical protein